MSNKVFIITGEPSGDLLGARLMQRMKAAQPGLGFVGVGGERMLAEGLQPLFPQRDLAVFGLWEIIPKLRLIFRRMREVVAAVRETKPSVVVTIDSPDFCFRVAGRLKDTGIPLIHYVAPSVWAWRPGRAKSIAKIFTHLLTLFRFEPPYFTREGLSSTFVGHPVIENGVSTGDGRRYRAMHAVAEDAPVLALLPGSRMSEVKRLLPVFRDVVEAVRAKYPNVHVALPTMPAVAGYVRDVVGQWPNPPTVLLGDEAKYDALAAARTALCASGTVNLEVALARVPMVVAYKISWVTALLYRGLIKIKLFSPVNVLLGGEVVPERVQHKCTPKRLLAALLPLFEPTSERAAQVGAISKVRSMLQDGEIMPSDRAASVVLAHIKVNARRHGARAFRHTKTQAG